MKEEIMMAFAEIETHKILSPNSRFQALKVIEAVYLQEKHWILQPENEIPVNIAQSQQTSWFLALVDRQPAGVIRLGYDPPLVYSPEMGITLKQGVNLSKMAAECKMVDIGRFMIIPQYRKNTRIALKLMRAAIQEVVGRGYTHFITDVFETDSTSPLRFHTKILGFEVIGSHLRGELNCSSTRIILTLDILKAYQRLKKRKDRVYYEVTEGLRERLDAKLAERLYYEVTDNVRQPNLLNKLQIPVK
jgi:hypothetical protein